MTTALRLANFTPACTALREGIFAKHGLAVEIAAASSVAEPISILNAGRAEFAMTGTGMVSTAAQNPATRRRKTRPVCGDLRHGARADRMVTAGALMRGTDEASGSLFSNLLGHQHRCV